MELLTEHLGHGLALSLILSLPCVLVAAGIGLIVGILQAVTQVQEQTIAAAPKILGVFLIILLGGGLMMTMMTNYLRESVQIAFNEIPQDGIFVMPPKEAQTVGQARAREFFKMQATNASMDRMKEMMALWRIPDEKGGISVIGTTAKSGPGNALGPAEQLMLNKSANR